MLLYIQIVLKQYKLASRQCSVLDRTSSLSKVKALCKIYVLFNIRVWMCKDERSVGSISYYTRRM